MKKPATHTSLGALSALFASSASGRARAHAPSPAVAGFRPAGIALAVAAAFLGAGQALGQPAGAQAIQGQASLQQQGNSLMVTTQNGAGTNRSVINWQSFSVPGGTSTRFNQPTAASLSINRVVGSDPSAIYGTLSSNGRLVLVNPAGIAVGAGAVVDTAGFTASTLRLSEADALAGRLVFGGDGLGGGPLKVDGHVVARSGDVVLIAPNVQVGSQAVVQAPNGATLLAAGQKVELTGRGLEGIRLELQAPQDQAVNLGTLQGDAVGIFAGQLKHSGLIQATAVTTEGGRVVLRAQGDSLVDGMVSAVAGTKGGSIDVFGNRVGLLAGAALDASGSAGGGSIRVGGDFQGRNADVPNAERTYVDANATIRADATGNGDGGRVIVWANDQTQSFGAISARGGEQGGDGGFVEVSGKHRLQFASAVDTRAPKGTTGMLLLDPDDIDVTTTGLAYVAAIPFDLLSTLGISLDVNTINSATTNVDLSAANSIMFSAAVNMANLGVGLSAHAGGTITVNAPITTNRGAVLLSAGEAAGPLRPSEGALYVNANIDTTGGGVSIAGANITLQSGLADLGGTAVRIGSPSPTPTPVTINAGTAGAVQVTGFWADVNDATISGASVTMAVDTGNVNLTNTTINTTGAAGVSLTTSGSSGAVVLTTTGVTATGTGGVFMDSDSGSVTLASSSVVTSGGAITLQGGSGTPSFGSAVLVGNSAMDAGTGTIAFEGNTQDPNSWGVVIEGSTTLHALGGTTVTGSNTSSLVSAGGGIHLSCGVACDISGLGPLALYGSSNASGTGVYVDGVGLNWAGPVSMVGNGTYGVQVSSSSIGVTGGGLSITGTLGVNINSSSIGIAGGDLKIMGSDSVDVFSASIGVTGGDLSITGNTVDIYGSAIATNGGAATFGATNGTLYFDYTGLDTGGGYASFSGNDASMSGSTIATGGGGFSMVGTPGAVLIDRSSIGTSGGAMTISGGSASLFGVAGVTIQNASSLHAGAGAVNIAGESADSAGFLFQLNGPPALTISGSDVNITGKTGLGSGAAALVVDGETIIATGRLTLNAIDGELGLVNGAALTAGAGGTLLSAVASAPAAFLPAIYLDAGSTLASAGEVQFNADSMTVDGAVNSGAARTVFTPVTAGRAISLGGIDDGSKLTLGAAGLSNITASEIVIGGAAFTGGITIDGPLSIGNAPALSLLQGQAGSITQVAGGTIAVSQLNVDAGTVVLTEANNVQALSGRASDAAGAGFNFSNAGGGDLLVKDLNVSGNAAIVGAPGASMDLQDAVVGGGLTWTGFANTKLASTGGLISAGGPITASGDVSLAGTLDIGAAGISSMTLPGTFTVLNGATLKFDVADAATYDHITAGAIAFPTAGGSSSVVVKAASQPANGAYKLISGSTSGTDNLPDFTTNIAGASLAFGSLVLKVDLASLGSAVDQIAGLIGSRALAGQVISEIDTNPLTMFTALLLKEETKQADDKRKGEDNVVDNNQCRR